MVPPYSNGRLAGKQVANPRRLPTENRWIPASTDDDADDDATQS
jgi:hypothetical protein